MNRQGNWERYKIRWSAIVMSRKGINTESHYIYYSPWDKIYMTIEEEILPEKYLKNGGIIDSEDINYDLFELIAGNQKLYDFD